MRIIIMIILIFFNIVISQAAELVKPDDVVNKLYTQIVKRHPLGIPFGADKASIWPFLSTRLIQIIETGQACQDDYYNNYYDEIDKPEFGWLEMGLFSGGDEHAMPSKVEVEHAEQQKDGSYFVYIQFTYKDYDRFETVSYWHGIVAVISEDGRFVIDDILLFKEDSTVIYYWLSKAFQNCDGPRWAGDTQEDQEEKKKRHIKEGPGLLRAPIKTGKGR